MAKGDSTDLFMKFVLEGNKALDGEATSDLFSAEGKSNKLLNGFERGKFFEIDRFNLKSGIHDDESDAQSDNHAMMQMLLNSQDPKAKQKLATLGSIAKKGGYKSFRESKDHKYPVDLKPVSFTRVIDKTSKHLMQNCIDSVSYDSATLIKRKASGMTNEKGEVAAGEVFLRLDFIGVLVISVDWDNDDKVNETIDFICRSVTINYRPQLPDGTLGHLKSGFWTMIPNERPVVLV